MEFDRKGEIRLSVIAIDYDLQSLQEMRDSVKQVKEAQLKYLSFTQEQVDAIVQKVAEAALNHSTELGRMAVEETGMGIAEHKKIKNEVGSRDVYESIRKMKTVGIINEDKTNKIVEVASPFGVIAAVVPTTNPTSTAIFKALISLKTRNGIIFSPHPNAVNCTIAALKVCSEAAMEAGAPNGIIGWISKPTMNATQELMKHKDIDLILATGGSGLVKAAYSSGKPAYGVGPGNVPAYIEKTANVKEAIKRIVDSKTFDNGTICATEQALIVDKNIKQLAMKELKNHGAYFLDDQEKTLVEKLISPAVGKLNPAIVGKYAVSIAKMAGIKVPSGTSLLIAEESKVGKDIPFSIEKLAPLFPLYTVEDYKEAQQLCGQLLNLGGRGHTLSLHTSEDEIAKEFAVSMPVSRILVNTPSAIGAVGGTTGLTPSLTLGCGSFGGNITSDNITASHLLNIKRLAYGLKDLDIPKPLAVHEEKKEQLNLDELVDEIMKQFNVQEKVDASTIADMVKEVLKQYQN